LRLTQEGSTLIEINGGSDIWAVAFPANGEYLVSGDGSSGRWQINGNNEAKCQRDLPGRNLLIFGVDFSLDSARLLTASKNKTATVWDLATRKTVLTLDREDWVIAAKCSLQGDRITTATRESVRVYDNIVAACSWTYPQKSPRHTPLVSTGPRTTSSSYPTVTFWDTSTHTLVGLIQLPRHITVRSLSRITVSIVFLWTILNLNNFLVPLVFPDMIRSHCLVHIPLSRNLKF
jgi:WD40 repeat protein